MSEKTATSNVEASVEELTEKAKRLLGLLAEPEPGIGMWHAAVGSALDALAEHAPSRTTAVSRQPDNECAPDIYEKGRTIAILAGASTAIEAVVVRVREDLKIPLDWHYAGGRALILTTVDSSHDKDILRELRCAVPVWASDPRTSVEGNANGP